VLLGPSGGGKTTALRCLAGLEEPDAGRVLLGDRVVVDVAGRVSVAPHRRDVGLVFQSFALWPHLTVRDNIAFPLRARRRPRAERASAVDDITALVDLDVSLLGRRPGQLSGGQQQRVALARALVARPRVVLFDEPLSNLDAPRREQLRTELRLLHRRIGFTAVYVTHDLQEALALGDRVAVVDRGRIAQAGATAEVFERPRTVTVARLLGFRPVARLVRAGDGWSVPGGVVEGAGPVAAGAPSVLDLYARPEAVRLARPLGAVDPRPGVIRVGGAVLGHAEPAGGHVDVVLDRAGSRLRAGVRQPDVGSWRAGTEVAIEVAAREARLFTAGGDAWEGRWAEAAPAPRSAPAGRVS